MGVKSMFLSAPKGRTGSVQNKNMRGNSSSVWILPLLNVSLNRFTPVNSVLPGVISMICAKLTEQIVNFQIGYWHSDHTGAFAFCNPNTLWNFEEFHIIGILLARCLKVREINVTPSDSLAGWQPKKNYTHPLFSNSFLLTQVLNETSAGYPRVIRLA